MDELRDITDKLAKVDDPAALLASLFAFSPIAYQVFDMDGHCLVANQAVRELFGSVPPPDYNIFNDNHAVATGVTHLIRRAFDGETIRLPKSWYDPRDVEHVEIREGKRVAIELTLFPLRDVLGTVRHVGLCYKDVTAEMELARAEGELRTSQDSLTALLNSMGEGVIAADTTGRVTRMNPVAERLTGWIAHEALGHPIDDVFKVVDEFTGASALNPVAQVLASGAAVALANHTVLLSRSLRQIAIADSGSPIRSVDGAVLGAVVVFRDVSADRKVAKERERLFEERAAALSQMQLILDSMPIACVLLDADFCTTYANPAAEKMFGYAAAELLGESPFARLIPPDKQSLVHGTFAHLTRLSADGQVPSALGAIITKDGREVIGDWSSTALANNDGEFRGVIVMAQDVTERVRAEEALRASEARYRSLAESTSAVVLTLDARGQVATPQRPWQEYTGQTWEAYRDFGAWTAAHPEDRPQMVHAWRDVLAHRRSFALELRLFHAASARYRHVVARGVPIFDDAGVPREWVGTIIDVDERRHALLELARLENQAAQVREANRLKSLFLANVSHELRTPLNAIIGFTELIADGVVAPGTDRHAECVGLVLSSSRHLLQLINDVLDLAKMEAGKLVFRPEPLELGATIAEVCAILQPISSGRDIRVVRELHGPAEVFIDPSRFKQVLYNYLSNALKHAPLNGRVVIRTSAAGLGEFRLEVEDDGPGIPEALQAQLFQEFQQLDGAGAAPDGGTGLGLALTRRIVEAQAGSVGVRSPAGERGGSVFYALLPVRVDEPAALA